MKYLNTTIPIPWYCQSEKFEVEIEKIFLNSWQLIGPESKIPNVGDTIKLTITCLLYTSPSPRDKRQSRMPSSA